MPARQPTIDRRPNSGMSLVTPGRVEKNPRRIRHSQRKTSVSNRIERFGLTPPFQPALVRISLARSSGPERDGSIQLSAQPGASRPQWLFPSGEMRHVGVVGSGWRCGQLEGPGHCSKGDREPIPRVDRRDRHGEIDQLFIRKVVLRHLIDVITHVVHADERHRFRPRECGALATAQQGAWY